MTTIRQIIDQAPVSHVQIKMIIICFFILFLDGIDTAAMGFIAPIITDTWHINKVDLGPVMSAALAGMIVGALIAGPLADRLGRKTILIAALIEFGSVCFLTASAQNLTQLTVWRFFTGLGLGAVMPNAVTYLAEYAPKRCQLFMTTSMFCGYSLGMASSGFISSWFVMIWGWQAFFQLGGLLPLILAIVAIFYLPESLTYLISKNSDMSRIQQIIRRVMPYYSTRDFTIWQEVQNKKQYWPIFSPPYLVNTLLLWASYFMGLFIIFLTISWLPIMMKEAGVAAPKAMFTVGLYQLGGVFSALLISWLIDRLKAYWIVALCYLLVGVLSYILGKYSAHLTYFAIMIFCAGACVNGAQSAMPSLSTQFYPTACRATGVAWMLGMGRFGGLLGAYLGAILIDRHWSLKEIFSYLTIPAVLAALFILLLRREKSVNNH